MRLQTRLILLFLLLAWVPVGATAWLLTVNTQEAFQEAFDRTATQLFDSVRARMGEVSAELGAALERMAKDPLLESELLGPLRLGSFYGDLDQERAIVREAKRLIASSPAVDTLRLVDLDKDGRVIALGHRRGQESPDREIVQLARAHPDGRVLRQERIEDASGAAKEVWTLQRLEVVDERVALVAGRLLDQRLVQGLVVGLGDTEVALSIKGERLAASFEGAEPEGGEGAYSVTRVALTNPGDEDEVATLSLYVSRGPMERRIQDLLQTAGVVAGAAGLLALLLGIWFSRRLSRPLEQLSDAASRVAGGARDVVVPELRGRDEVATLTRAFNRMTLDLDEADERLRQSERVAAWREIARRIAHEIKNPLFPIQMSIETLQKVWKRKHPDFEEIFDESTATILEEVDRMKRIVTEFSNFARMPAPKPRDIDLADLSRQILQLHEGAAEGVELRREGAEEVMAEVDPDQMRQALMNLVQNGIDAMKATAEERAAVMEVRVEPAETDETGRAWVRVVVTDTGTGMDEETQKKLFTPYFTTKTKGTGLGLAMVHRIVTEHGGAVRVDSKPGVGTRFALTLPRRQGRAPAG